MKDQLCVCVCEEEKDKRKGEEQWMEKDQKRETDSQADTLDLQERWNSPILKGPNRRDEWNSWCPKTTAELLLITAPRPEPSSRAARSYCIVEECYWNAKCELLHIVCHKIIFSWHRQRQKKKNTSSEVFETHSFHLKSEFDITAWACRIHWQNRQINGDKLHGKPEELLFRRATVELKLEPQVELSSEARRGQRSRSRRKSHDLQLEIN